jgi:hypothetical protein
VKSVPQLLQRNGSLLDDAAFGRTASLPSAFDLLAGLADILGKHCTIFNAFEDPFGFLTIGRRRIALGDGAMDFRSHHPVSACA